jgi:hypothetical protein
LAGETVVSVVLVWSADIVSTHHEKRRQGKNVVSPQLNCEKHWRSGCTNSNICRGQIFLRLANFHEESDAR